MKTARPLGSTARYQPRLSSPENVETMTAGLRGSAESNTHARTEKLCGIGSDAVIETPSAHPPNDGRAR